MFKEIMEGIESIRQEIIKPDQLRYGKKQIEILEIKNNIVFRKIWPQYHRSS